MDNLAKVDGELEEIITGEVEPVFEEEESKHKTFADKLAFAVSAVLSPFLIAPIFVFLVVQAYSVTSKEFLIYMSICFLFSTVVPFLHIYIQYRRGKVTDVHVAVREERKGPFIACILSILAGTLILYFVDAPKEIVVLGAVMTMSALLFFVITLFWKISMHSTVLGAIITSLMILLSPVFAYGYFLIPLMIWARIKRQRHNIYQGIAATVLSILCTYLLFKAFGMPK